MKRDDVLRAGLAAAVTLGVVLGYWWYRSPDATLVKVGQKAPELELPSLGGAKATLSSLRGRPALLVFFLSGCHICESEIGEVERLHRQYLDRGLRVVGVAVDLDTRSAQDFARRHEITFPVLLDPDAVELRKTFGSYKMPEAYLLDATGTVDAVYLGSVKWRSREVRERIERLLPPPLPRASMP